MLPPKIAMTLKKFVHPNIMTVRKCITLKYLTKIGRCPCFDKSNIYERNSSKFDWENFILDHFSVDWKDLLKIDEFNADNSTKIHFYRTNMLLDTYAHIKNLINTS